MVMVISTLKILPSRLMMTLGMVQVLSLNFNDRLFSMGNGNLNLIEWFVTKSSTLS